MAFDSYGNCYLAPLGLMVYIQWNYEPEICYNDLRDYLLREQGTHVIFIRYSGLTPDCSLLLTFHYQSPVL